MKVTRLPGIVPKPLPNEHPLGLEGSGRAAKQAAQFRIRKKGTLNWFTGTAAECARKFGLQPSLICKWAAGKTSQNYELEKVR